MFTEGTCKLLSLVISDLVDEDVVLHSRPQAVSALIFGTAALVSKPGQTLAPVIGTWILALQTGSYFLLLYAYFCRIISVLRCSCTELSI